MSFVTGVINHALSASREDVCDVAHLSRRRPRWRRTYRCPRPLRLAFLKFAVNKKGFCYLEPGAPSMTRPHRGMGGKARVCASSKTQSEGCGRQPASGLQSAKGASFVSGHDFSRAENTLKQKLGFSPCGIGKHRKPIGRHVRTILRTPEAVGKTLFMRSAGSSGKRSRKVRGCSSVRSTMDRT